MRPALVALLMGCGSVPDGSLEPPSREGLPAATQPAGFESPISDGISPDQEPGFEPAPTAVVIGIRRVAVQTREAEDGRGSLIEALDPVAVEIEADNWPGRALDPVLQVDDRRFRNYTHPGPGRIQFVLAEAAWLDEAQALSIRYDCPNGCIADPEVLQLPLPSPAVP